MRNIVLRTRLEMNHNVAFAAENKQRAFSSVIGPAVYVSLFLS